MTTPADLAHKVTADFITFLRNHGHDVESIDSSAVDGYAPVIEIDHETVYGDFSLRPQFSENGQLDGQYIWDFMNGRSGALIESELDQTAPMDKIYEFFKDCLEQSKTL